MPTLELSHDWYEATRQAFNDGQKIAREQILAEEGLIPRYEFEALKLEIEAAYQVIAKVKEERDLLKHALKHAVLRGHLHHPAICDGCADAEKALKAD